MVSKKREEKRLELDYLKEFCKSNGNSTREKFIFDLTKQFFKKVESSYLHSLDSGHQKDGSLTGMRTAGGSSTLTHGGTSH